MITGVYSIINKINYKTYIGSSKDIDRRWREHINNLNKNKHINHALQHDWNEYGQDNFKFSVIKQCDEKDLKYIELEEINDAWEELYNAPSIKDELIYLISNHLIKKSKEFEVDFKSQDCVNKKPLNFNIFVKGDGKEKELYFSLRNLDYTKTLEDEEKYIQSSQIKMNYVHERSGELIEIEYGG